MIIWIEKDVFQCIFTLIVNAMTVLNWKNVENRTTIKIKQAYRKITEASVNYSFFLTDFVFYEL